MGHVEWHVKSNLMRIMLESQVMHSVADLHYLQFGIEQLEQV
jgi:hypothetical protein